MYPRLKLARNLLTDDGVIFISIDENEIANLRKICNEIFGEDNFIGTFIWRKKDGGGQAKDYFVIEHEYIVGYRKSDALQWEDEKEIRDINEYKKIDAKGRYKITKLAKWGNTARREDRPSMYFPLNAPDGTLAYPIAPDGNDGRWRIGKEKMNELVQNDLIYWEKKNDLWIPYEKEYFTNQSKIIKQRSILYDVANTGDGTDCLTELFGIKDIFENPKPFEIIIKLLKPVTSKNDIILDFFSGSATMAHAVMKLNAEDGFNRKYICVQLPEKTESNSVANKAGYQTICEIGKERIRRAGEKIKEENKGKEGIDNLDIGFKVFKLDSSNLVKWDNTPTTDEEEVKKRIQQSLFYRVEGREDLDLVYEIMLKYGLSLTLPVEERKFDGVTAYIINHPDYKVLICLQPNITLSAVEEMDKETIGTYIFADRCFADANILSNTEEILKKKDKEMRLF
jgi:type III restriction-modification system methyltransferase